LNQCFWIQGGQNGYQQSKKEDILCFEESDIHSGGIKTFSGAWWFFMKLKNSCYDFKKLCFLF